VRLSLSGKERRRKQTTNKSNNNAYAKQQQNFSFFAKWYLQTRNPYTESQGERNKTETFQAISWRVLRKHVEILASSEAKKKSHDVQNIVGRNKKIC
jgi:hypothetical protein